MSQFSSVFRYIVSVLSLCLSVLLWPSLGSAAVLQGFYKLPASLDTTVSSEMVTELWAQVYRPDTAGPHPLLVFLHGNHGTCGFFSGGIRIDDRTDYTFTGTCPAGYVPTPNHLGYAYLANNLASRGYVVVSINANRGVNAAPGVSGDGGLNLRRGRLVLRHLQQLSQWNAGVGTPPGSLGFGLAGVLDFAHVGLFGHSRGGEGIRAAVAQFRDAGSPWPARIGAITFEGLIEVGPVDGQTSRTLNAPDLPWHVLLPACDGDVSDLQGVKPFDRMLITGTETLTVKKSTMQVFGANHNFYNTQWQQSDAGGCLGQTPLFPSTVGSAAQRTTAIHQVIPFFIANVGAAKLPGQALRFDPSYPLPAVMTSVTAYARGYSPTPRTNFNFVIDNFDQATGTSSRLVPNQSSGLTSYTHGTAGSSHSSFQRAAAVGWNSAGGFLQVNAANAGVPLNVSIYRALEFRVMMRCFGSLCSTAADPTGGVDFNIALANSNGTLSSNIALKSVAAVRRPAGSFSNNTVLQTVRIPLTAFTGADLAAFRGVRFTFNISNTSQISLANVRLTRTAAGPGGLALAAQDVAATGGAVAKQLASADVNRIVAVRRTAAAGTQKAQVEIEVASSRDFTVGGALPVLNIGGQTFTLSRYPQGKVNHLIFMLDAAEFDALQSGAPVSVKIGGARHWDMGRLVK